MKNFWLTFFEGLVEVKMKGIGAERFINRLCKEGVAVFQFKKLDKEISTYQIRLSNIRSLRKIARGQAFKFSFTRRKGMPFFLNKLMKNKGLVIGIPFFIAIVFVLSNIVWSIKIDGASIETEQKIRKQLKLMDVRIGKFSFNEGDPKAIQKRLTDEIPNITWIGVQSRGAVYHLRVVEKLIPKKEIDKSYPMLVSTKKAYIVQTMIETGQILVVKKQLVEKGQPLVDGYIGSGENPKYVGAKGIVLGETWYQTTSEVPLKTTFQKLTGNTKTKHQLKLFNITIPIWGFGHSKFKEKTIERVQTDFHFWKWKIPLSIVKVQYNEAVTTIRILTQEEGMELAKENAYKDLLLSIPPDAKVLKRNLLQKKISSDKVMVMMHYEVIEDIAAGSGDEDEYPISDSDEIE
ncbi:MAG: yqfD [Bacillales bacterium]|jgi:similar to stage IV sporulation protein|nr:yqfD [Bacillales bacterium]